tara:strand:- start:2735 stop:5755 length:3021 start_codon:yes stop_codon:yes gene_type:complete
MSFDVIINSPFEEPNLHHRFNKNGITQNITEKRRPSSYFIPIPSGQKTDDQLTLWTNEREKENEFINKVRAEVMKWRSENYPNISQVTRNLLEHWKNTKRERRLFFCQIEAVETLIFLKESSEKTGNQFILNELKKINKDYNEEINRLAFKMATGSGKTFVMAMMILWNGINKFFYKTDKKFANQFLILTPGITIRDRLKVLNPNENENIYDQYDLIPLNYKKVISTIKLEILNWHQLQARTKVDVGRQTQKILGKKFLDNNQESDKDIVNRVCKNFSKTSNVAVINDEAHHCHKTLSEKIKDLKGDDKKEAEDELRTATVWFDGIKKISKIFNLNNVYDLSATPFWLKGSGFQEGSIFPWVVSDFSLVDAIESGIVKIPRVPVKDDASDQTEENKPKYRDIWKEISKQLPKGGKQDLPENPNLPPLLESAILALYSHYEESFNEWEKNKDNNNEPQPVFIIVCNNINVSNEIYRFISGYKKIVNDKEIWVEGKLKIFSNVKPKVGENELIKNPNTIIVDSKQLEAGTNITPDFKRISDDILSEFKNDYGKKYGSENAKKLTDGDILREVMNTVAKKNKLGQNIKCVVSVSMLTEGWDVNSVTHILGVRAFGTQLLCEQVVGRGLRRISYAYDKKEIVINNKTKIIDCFPAEYADVYGVPFSFIQTRGKRDKSIGEKKSTRVFAMEERSHLGIEFPNVEGYKYHITDSKLVAELNDDDVKFVIKKNSPLININQGILGEESIQTLSELENEREQKVAFNLAKLVIERYFRNDDREFTLDDKIKEKFDENVKVHRFEEVLNITKEWMEKCIVLEKDTFVQFLLLSNLAFHASEKIYNAIVKGTQKIHQEKTLVPILNPYNKYSSTSYVNFDTVKECMRTSTEKCHISHVVQDSGWEKRVAKYIEQIPEVIKYVKNDHLGFMIPYTLGGFHKNYYPDFICVLKRKNEENLNLILEVSGEDKEDKRQKVSTAKNLWIPSINNFSKEFGSWEFVEVTDPEDTKKIIERFI